MPSVTDRNKLIPARILMFSQRNILEKFHYRCSLYEFEDLIQEMDAVDLISPLPNKWFSKGTRIAQKLAHKYAVSMNPGIPKTNINNNYDLFFAVCQFPKDLLHVESIEGWKDHCKTSICWLNEIWISEIYKYRCYLSILSKFDQVIINCSQSVDAVNEVIGEKCSYLPPGIDSILYCPYPGKNKRLIDVYSVGRRSEKTHRSILKMVKENNIFYIYDSIIGDKVLNRRQHRLLFSNIAKRSRYFLVNPGKIDSPSEINSQSEIGTRYFEGLASGSIMIGEHPNNEEFRKIFYWPDSVIHLPYDSDKIEQIIGDLDKQPFRQEKIREKNTTESLLRHDWAYRWEEVLKMANLKGLAELFERKKKLSDMASVVLEDSTLT